MSGKDEAIAVEMLVRFKARNLITQDDLDHYYGPDEPITLMGFVKILIEEEGLFGVVDDGYEVVEVRRL